MPSAWCPVSEWDSVRITVESFALADAMRHPSRSSSRSRSIAISLETNGSDRGVALARENDCQTPPWSGLSGSRGISDADLTELVTESQGHGATDAWGELAPGTRIGQYCIVRALATGGMGAVYLADQLEPVRRRVAIKFMTASRFSPEHRFRFELERQSLAQMSHPAIAQIHDAGATLEGHLYLVMEYVEGIALDRWVSSRRPSVHARVALLRDACRAVAHAHAKAVLHCDIKPSNLLVTEIDGQPFVKLIDFGIARAAGERGRELAGTPGYISPEQSRGAPIDQRSDVFSLGVLLFEAVTGTRYRSWAGATVSLDEARRLIAEELPKPLDAEPIRGLGGARRRELEAILHKTLDPDGERRYASADALAEDLTHWLANEPVAAMGKGDWYRVACFIRRQPAFSLSFALSVLILGLLGWRLVAQLAETRRERDIAHQVTELLLDLFRKADPYRYPGGSMSVRDLLRGSAEHLRETPLDAAVRMRVLSAVAEVQSRLELYSESARSLAVASELAADALEHARLQAAQAQALMNAEDFDAATALADAALAKLPVSAVADRADALLVRAEIGEYTEDLARVRSLLAEADPLVARANDPELRHRLQRQLGRVVLAAGDADAAVTHLSAAHDTARGHFGAQDLRTIDTLSDLAVARARAGDLERSEQERRAIVTLTEGIWGEDSPGLATALSNLCAILQRRGGESRLREAVDSGRRAYDILQRALGNDSMETALAANNLANVLGLVGEHAAAELLHAAAVRGLEASLGGAHSHLGIALTNQARNLIQLNRGIEAGSLLERAGDILAASLGEEHPRYALWRLTRAEWLFVMGRRDAAAVEVGAAQPLISGHFPAHSPETERLRTLLDAVAEAH